MRASFLLTALFIAIGAQAQWANNTDLNTLVSESGSDDMKAVTTSDGKTFVVFWKSVSEPTNYELRVQLLDFNGNRLFGDEGMLISDTIPMDTYTVIWSIALDVNDNLFIGVTGTGNESGYLYKIDKVGNQKGIFLDETAFAITLLPLKSGEVIVSWVPGLNAVLQKYDVDGNAVWNEPQLVLSGNSKTFPGTLFELSNGDFELIFHTYNYGTSSNLWAQKFNSDGIPQWTSPIKISTGSTAFNRIYSGSQDSDTVYFGYSSVTNSRYDSFLQRINPDGSLPWGINGIDFDINQTDFEKDTRIAHSSASQYIWAVCTYSNSLQDEFGEYVQKFDKTTGERQLTDNAKMLYPLEEDTKIHAGPLTLINDQPFFLLQVGYNDSFSPNSISVVLLDGKGDFVWAEETKPIATYEAFKSRITFTEQINGQSVAIFVEDRGEGPRIYAQNFLGELPLPSQPELSFPGEGDNNIPLSLIFIWEAASNAENYNIQIATDVTFTNVVAEDNGIIGTEFECTLDFYQTTYFWHVQAVNSTGNSEWSEVWSFTTLLETSIDSITTPKIKIYPNPVLDALIINAKEGESAEIINNLGEHVRNITSQEITGKVNVSDLRKGLYLLRLFDSKGSIIATTRFIKL